MAGLDPAIFLPPLGLRAMPGSEAGHDDQK
jgi:hypothetical protein